MELREGAPAREIRLTQADAAALQLTGLVDVELAPEPGSWLVRPSRKVGAARWGDRQVVVHPKVEIARLAFMLGYSLRPDIWRDDRIRLTTENDLMAAMAAMFARLAESAYAHGVPQGYRVVEESASVLRGRLRVGDQLARHGRIMLPIEVTYDDYSVDIAENQIVLSAILMLLSVPRVESSDRARLQRLRRALTGVTPVVPGNVLPFWRATRLNVRVDPAVRLAEWVLRRRTFEHRAGSTTVEGYAVDVWRVFEDFVATALAEVLMPAGFHVRPQGRGLRLVLDEEEGVRLKPDVVVLKDGGLVAVADVKYKRVLSDDYPNADIYQVLAYCTAMELRRGHLIYAAGEAEWDQRTVRNADVTIHCHSIDLQLAPSQLLDRIAEIGAAISA